MDRLHSILRQGLLVCSGTPLMRHGTAYGEGVYMTSDSSKCSRFTWASASKSFSGREMYNERSLFQGLGVLLACEVVDDLHSDRSYLDGFSDIHVISDPARIMVRYVFMIGSNDELEPGEAVPTIERVLTSLRSGKL